MTFEDVITEHLLLAILRFVPIEDLLSSATLVARRWRAACASQALWLARLPAPLKATSANQYGKPGGPLQLYHALYCTNLLLNPSLQLSEQLPNRISSGGMPGRGRTPWYTMDCAWVWEGHSPEGLPSPPPMPPQPLPQYAPQGAVRHPMGVLSSPNSWSCMLQVVELPHELQRRGVASEDAAALLDSCPPLELSLWHCGHVSGRARCEVWLALDGGQGGIPSWLQATNFASGHYAAVATTGVTPSPRACWTRVYLRLQGYPAGCRRAFVALKGEGNSALLGENVGVWGAKFAAPTLRLLPVDEAG